MFARWDDDGQGVLDVEEFRHLLRVGLKINKLEVPDSHVDMLITALDDDASGTVSIDELADFVDRGTATFFSGPVTPAAMETAPIHQRQPSRDLNKAVVSKLQSRLKAALYGTDALAFFSRYDRDGLGTVDAPGFKSLIRRDLKLPASFLSDNEILKLMRAIQLPEDEGPVSTTGGGGGGGLGVHYPLGHDANLVVSIDELIGLFDLQGEGAVRRSAGAGSKTQHGSWHPQRKRQGGSGSSSKRKPIDEAVAKKLQSKLKAACYGTTPQVRRHTARSLHHHHHHHQVLICVCHCPPIRSCSSGGTTTARACWTRTSSQSSCAQVSDSPRWRCPTHTSQRWWRRSTTTGAGRSASPSWQTSSSAARPRSSLALRLKACSHRISAARGQSSPSEHGRSKGLAAERRRRSTRRWPRSCNRSSRRPATGPRRRSCSRDGTSMGRACWTRTSSGNSCGPASS
mmetsp:Transcript_98103/g.280775  ORF Transcript_98103/g.280775 Transcript_98103/m.280775 type:complete len:457 (-) Transcript_98103:606-1976(-)